MSLKTELITVRMSEDLARECDSYCQKIGISRSSGIAMIVYKFFEDRKQLEALKLVSEAYNNADNTSSNESIKIEKAIKDVYENLKESK